MKHTILSIRKKSFAYRLQSASCFALLAASALVLFCSRDYNPFSDLQNARAHVLSWSFAGRDSVPVYMTGTLAVGVALREKVDSFTISASHNRFWSDTTVKRTSPGSVLDAEVFSFSISFCDTGMETVSVHTHRVSGGIVTEDLFIRSTLLLHQPDVTGFFGVPLVLSTPPVADKDVFYQWDFGPGRLVRSSSDSATAVFVSGLSSGTATINVTDLSGNHATPCGLFTYSLNDTSHPVISCINDSLHGDTLVTRDSVLAFKAEIVNYGDRPADSCWVNSSAFDISYPQLHRYTKLFKDISSYTRINPLRITVYAIGNKQFPLLKSRRTFWAVFDTAGVSNLGAGIDFIVPLKDSSSTAIRDYMIFGTAQNYRNDSMVLRVTVNDSPYQALRVIAGGSGTWEWPVYLDSSVNLITVTALDDGNNVLTSKHVTVVYDSTIQDRLKPVIWEITAEGKPADNLFTRQANVALQVIAFDEGSGIQSLTIDGATAAPDSSGYIWLQYIGPLVHSASGNRIAISAEDRNHNVNDTAVFIFRNTPPELVSGPAVPAYVYVGSSYAFRISSKDADNDPVSVIPLDTPVTMVVSRDGAISWTPAAADAGPGALSVLLNDGYESAGPFTWTFACIDSTLPIIPLHFTTRERDFPAVLQAGKDTLVIRLVTDSSGMALGKTILRYSALFTDRTQSLFTNDTSSLLVWAPTAADTGYRRLRVTVGNGFTDFDTIAPAIRVVPMNRWPCSLSWSFTGDTTPAGELDLFSRAVPETLFFAIRDSDDLSTEKYTVAISQNAVRSVAVLNKREFTVVVRPDPADTLDTLLVSIRDMTGTADSATFVIRNRQPALGPYTKRLYLNTTVVGANVAGTVTDFPVLVRLAWSNFNFLQAYKTGEDIRFSKPNGISLPFEIERWDSQNGIAEIWVKADTVYGNDSTHYMVMSWGIPASGVNPVSQNVFDTAGGFQGVWHLNEVTGQAARDATANHFDGTPSDTAPASMAGMIGIAQNFNGVSSALQMKGTGNSKLNFPKNGYFSVSAWVNADTLDVNTSHMIVGKGHKQYFLKLYAEWEFTEFGSDSTWQMTHWGPPVAQQWKYLVGTREGNVENLYLDGTLVNSNTFSGSTSGLGDTSSDVSIGRYLQYVTESNQGFSFFDGAIDEVRISSVSRSADWIKLCYMNQKAVDALVVFK